ncbi:aldose 1-epimerase [Rhizobium leguminosarum]|uniref:aldose epimerase family protein n=1 Tax=Rhizobium leguminosarum TaxID=384 RepID=UPI0024A96A10|nr:aldose 1-epimerase [Rhizobium leguminosarum]MDI5929782.1 aldose 1-epimerase [Rhizobium leguminosarum]
MGRSLAAGEAVEIASGELVAKCSPHMGGRLLELSTREGLDVLVPTSPHSFDVTAWPKAGAYPLIPYHNRISEACITVGDQRIALASHPLASPHTLHGPGHTRPWLLSSHAASALSLTMDYAADEDWPWDFRAVQTYRLADNELKLSLSLENLSQAPMPAGLGWHPYFYSTEPVQTDAKAVWLHRGDYLPTGERRAVIGEHTESSKPTRYLESWSEARIRLTGGGTALVSASTELGFLVVHRGDAHHICVEPVSHVPDAWNMRFDRAATGARILGAGERLEGSISVRVHC